MAQFILRLIKWIFFIFVSVLACLLILGFFFSPNCGGDSPKAAYARSIPEERLERLYESLIEIKSAHEERTRARLEKLGVDYFEIPLSLSYEASPEDIKDIEFSNIRIGKNHSRIMLQGCFDNFLTMNIEGLYGEKNPKLILNWGEFESVSETLWEK